MKVRLGSALAVVLMASPASLPVVLPQAGWAQEIGIPHGFDLGRYARSVIFLESGGDYGAWNSDAASGAAGAYQFLPAALADANFVTGDLRGGWASVSWTPVARNYGITSMSTFLMSREGQDEAFRRYTMVLWRQLNAVSPNAVAAIGSIIDGQPVTEGGVLALAHFAGAGGAGQFFRHMDDFTQMPAYSRFRASNPRIFASQASIRAFMVERLRLGAEAHPPVRSEPSIRLSCFTTPILQAGARVSSPFGVDRTGRASSGYHVGLDMVDNVRGEMRAGMPMRVISGPGGSVNGFKMETADGRQRVGFLHNRVVRVRPGDEVAADQVVALMGDRGSPGAVHLHLMMQLRADVVRQAAESVGKVWAEGSLGYGTKGPSATAATVSSATGDTYFVVNPEPYLWDRVPFNANLLRDYANQGLSRPDGLTLEPTCGPTVEDIDNERISSTNGGDTSGGGLATTGTGTAMTDQVAAAMATEEGRDAVIEYMTASLGELETRRTALEGDSLRAVAWAGFGLATATSVQIDAGVDSGEE